MITRIGKKEHLQIVTSTNNSTPGNVSLPSRNVMDVLIQNVGANACYVTVEIDTNPTADNTGIYLAAKDGITLEDVRWNYFAVINADAGQNNTVNIAVFGS